jgi:hypothetical protein
MGSILRRFQEPFAGGWLKVQITLGQCVPQGFTALAKCRLDHAKKKRFVMGRDGAGDPKNRMPTTVESTLGAGKEQGCPHLHQYIRASAQ